MHIYKVAYGNWSECGAMEVLHSDLKTQAELQADILTILPDACRVWLEDHGYILNFDQFILRAVADQLVSQLGYEHVQFAAKVDINGNDGLIQEPEGYEAEDEFVQRMRCVLEETGIADIVRKKQEEREERYRKQREETSE
jgi:hypothetical protein